MYFKLGFMEKTMSNPNRITRWYHKDLTGHFVLPQGATAKQAATQKDYEWLVHDLHDFVPPGSYRQKATRQLHKDFIKALSLG